MYLKVNEKENKEGAPTDKVMARRVMESGRYEEKVGGEEKVATS